MLKNLDVSFAYFKGLIINNPIPDLKKNFVDYFTSKFLNINSHNSL